MLFIVQISRLFFEAKDEQQVLKKLGKQIENGRVYQEHAMADVLVTCLEEQGGRVTFHLEDVKPVPPARRNKAGEFVPKGDQDER